MATRRYLSRRGFRRGARTGNVQMAAAHVNLRDAYLVAIKENRALPAQEQLREVYLDESYIHQHYHRLEDSVWDPNDSQDRKVRLQHKGQRYCILAAIQNASPRDADTGPGLVPGSVWTFVPQAQKGKKVHEGDYHKNFNGANFAKWWKEQLLPGLTEPSLIVMDNAAYHKTKPPDTPNPTKMKKAEVQAALTARGVVYSPSMSAVQLKFLLKSAVVDHVKPEVVQAAEAAGHRVIFTPPHYSDLQPIELVWALIKGNVGRQYSEGTKLSDVKSRLDREFAQLQTPQGSLQVGKIIGSVDKHIAKFWAEMQADDTEVGDEVELEEAESDREPSADEGASDSDDDDA